MLDHAALPPEVNSGLMYAGPGSGPMLAAATAWDSLAAELHATAAGYQSVISGLTGQSWRGPASAAMAAAAAPYMTWMSATATQAEQTAAQARAAVAAYEVAHAATVPPAVVAANRTELLTLVATNVLGQNTPAIAANEAEYAEMWALDAAAMAGYVDAALSARALSPFSAPPQITNPAGSAGSAGSLEQAGLVGQVAGRSALSAGVGRVQAITSPLSAGSTTGSSTLTGSSALTGLSQLIGVSSVKDALGYGMMVPQNGSYGMALATAGAGLAKLFAPAASAAAGAAGAVSAGPTALGGLGGASSLMSSVTAGLGHSGTIGSLSVPQAWAAASPLTNSVMGSTLSSSLSSALGTSGTNAGSLANGVPMLANAAARAAGDKTPMVLPRFDVRPSIIPLTPAAG